MIKDLFCKKTKKINRAEFFVQFFKNGPIRGIVLLLWAPQRFEFEICFKNINQHLQLSTCANFQVISSTQSKVEMSTFVSTNQNRLSVQRIPLVENRI